LQLHEEYIKSIILTIEGMQKSTSMVKPWNQLLTKKSFDLFWGDEAKNTLDTANF
jgi:hypothetical protein